MLSRMITFDATEPAGNRSCRRGISSWRTCPAPGRVRHRCCCSSCTRTLPHPVALCSPWIRERSCFAFVSACSVDPAPLSDDLCFRMRDTYLACNTTTRFGAPFNQESSSLHRAHSRSRLGANPCGQPASLVFGSPGRPGDERLNI